MAAKELYGSLSYTVSKQNAMTGKRIFICPWSEIFSGNAAGLPRIGDPFPFDAQLKASNISVTPFGLNKTGALTDEYVNGKVEVDYTTPQFDEEKEKVSYEIGGDMLEVGQGRHWDLDGNPAVDAPIYLWVPMIEMCVQRTLLDSPTNSLIGKVGKINSETWRGWPRGHVLYLGATTTVEWTGSTWKWCISWKFRINPVREHNYFYDKDIADWAIILPWVYQYEDLNY
jgi:hypothetical protein